MCWYLVTEGYIDMGSPPSTCAAHVRGVGCNSYIEALQQAAIRCASFERIIHYHHRTWINTADRGSDTRRVLEELSIAIPLLDALAYRQRDGTAAASLGMLPKAWAQGGEQ